MSISQEGGEAVLCTRDNGLGIEPEMQERIFELFVQAQNAGTVRWRHGDWTGDGAKDCSPSWWSSRGA